jgi:hypothetical protein
MFAAMDAAEQCCRSVQQVQQQQCSQGHELSSGSNGSSVGQ